MDTDGSGKPSFRDTSVLGQKLIGASADDSPFFEALSDEGFAFGQMPAKRRKLTEDNVDGGSEKLQFIKQWMDKGSPGHDQEMGATQEIKEIRIFPPIAIGRMGSSTQPMDNYDLVDADSADGFRKLEPA